MSVCSTYSSHHRNQSNPCIKTWTMLQSLSLPPSALTSLFLTHPFAGKLGSLLLLILHSRDFATASQSPQDHLPKMCTWLSCSTYCPPEEFYSASCFSYSNHCNYFLIFIICFFPIELTINPTIGSFLDVCFVYFHIPQHNTFLE